MPVQLSPHLAVIFLLSGCGENGQSRVQGSKENLRMVQSLRKFIKAPLNKFKMPFSPLWISRQIKGKKALIDFACRRIGIRSFADLGGIWGVDGEYTFYVMKTYEIEAAFLVDITCNDTVIEKKKLYPTLKIINGNFGDEEIARQIAGVDAVILFDVLLHQVRPDWSEILDMYAYRTKCFLIFNPQFIASKNTIRLLDLGEENYFRNIPHTKDEEPYKAVFEKMYEVHPRPQYKNQRIYRDIHDIWQWGIVDSDLVAKMEILGFTLHYFKNWGRFSNLANFENHAFAFWR
jgi:hypothetical protein